MYGVHPVCYEPGFHACRAVQKQATMAGQAAKKRLEENRKRLRLLGTFLIVGLACQLISLALRSRKGAVTTSSIVGLVFTTGVGYLCYQTISSIAKPVYHEGELIDGGGDLNRGGINGYAHDILYITAFVQVRADRAARVCRERVQTGTQGSPSRSAGLSTQSGRVPHRRAEPSAVCSAVCRSRRFCRPGSGTST